MYCIHCGASLKETDIICAQCGKAVYTTRKEEQNLAAHEEIATDSGPQHDGPAESSAGTQGEPVVSNGQQLLLQSGADVGETASTRSPRKVIVFCAALIAIVAVGIVALVAFGRTDNPESVPAASRQEADAALGEQPQSQNLVAGGLGFTMDEMMELLDERLERNHSPTLTESFYNEVQLEDGRTAYRYRLVQGIYFYFLCDEQGMVLQFLYDANELILPADAFQLYGYLNLSLPYILEPADFQEMETALGGNGRYETGKRVYTRLGGGKDNTLQLQLSEEEPVDFQELFLPVGRDLTETDFIAFFEESMNGLGLFDPEAASWGELGSGFIAGADSSFFDFGNGDRIYWHATEGVVEELMYVASKQTPYSLEHPDLYRICTASCLLLYEQPEVVSTAVESLDYLNAMEQGVRIYNGEYTQVQISNDLEDMSFVITTRPGRMIVPAQEEPAEEAEATSDVSAPGEQSAQSAESPGQSQQNPYAEGPPRFVGGMGRIGERDAAGNLIAVSAFTLSDTLYVDGYLYGLQGENRLLERWEMSNGTLIEWPVYYQKSGDHLHGGITADQLGVGSGTYTLILESTGEIMATLSFSVSE